MNKMERKLEAFYFRNNNVKNFIVLTNVDK